MLGHRRRVRCRVRSLSRSSGGPGADRFAGTIGAVRHRGSREGSCLRQSPESFWVAALAARIANIRQKSEMPNLDLLGRFLLNVEFKRKSTASRGKQSIHFAVDLLRGL